MKRKQDKKSFTNKKSPDLPEEKKIKKKKIENSNINLSSEKNEIIDVRDEKNQKNEKNEKNEKKVEIQKNEKNEKKIEIEKKQPSFSSIMKDIRNEKLKLPKRISKLPKRDENIVYDFNENKNEKIDKNSKTIESKKSRKKTSKIWFLVNKLPKVEKSKFKENLSINKKKEEIKKKPKKKDNSVQCECLLCNLEFGVTDGSTSHVWDHFRDYHSDLYNELIKLKKDKVGMNSFIEKTLANSRNNKIVQKQTKIEERFEKKIENSSTKYIEKILDWLSIGIKHGISFSFLGCDDIRNHQNYYNDSEYPGRNELANEFLVGLHNLTCRFIVDKIKNIDFMALTTDGWCSINKESFIAITAHFFEQIIQKDFFTGEVSKKLIYRNIVLAVSPIFVRETSENIKDFILKKVETILGKNTEVSAIVCDNGKNFTKASNEIADVINCLGHTLQLCINDVLSGNKYCEEIMKARNIVKRIRSSKLTNDDLKNFQGNNSLELILDVKTRWNSLFYMLRRFVKLDEFIKKVFNNYEFQKEGLIYPNILILFEIVTVLQPIEEITNVFSSEVYPTISSIPYFINEIKKKLTENFTSKIEITQELKKKLLEALNLRFDYIFTKENMILKACALDPRYGNLDFISKELRNDIWITLEEELKKILVQKKKDKEEKEKTINQVEDLIPNFNFTLFDEVKLLKENFEKNHESLKKNNNVLEWWDNFIQKGGEKLKWLFMKYLCIPATSTPSERAFSSAGVIYNKMRANLEVETVELLVFLRENYDLIPKGKELNKLIEELSIKIEKNKEKKQQKLIISK